MEKYRYNKQAGALNEAAADVTLNAPVTPQRAAPIAQSSLAAPDDYAGGHQTLVSRMPAAAPGVHAQATEATRRPEARTTLAGGGGNNHGRDPVTPQGVQGMWFYTVQDGQRARMIRPDGSVEVIVGPRRVWRGSNRFEVMAHYVAHPGEFLVVRFRDGRQEHLTGPSNLWFDPRAHMEVSKEDALQIAAKEAVVVYSKGGDGTVSRRVVHGPATFVPAPGEWLHTFSWHGSRGGHKGYQKVPNALVFQKLWLLPDQMYHDVPDVRTGDDAVITIRLMLFFELVDVETMLGTTHDPIGDFVNAATSDVVEFTGRNDFDGFKRQTDKLNDLATYRQLVARAEQCGYRINKIVYRGYGAPESLQRMHDEAIESRTRLQLERATQQQAQDLEDFKLERQLARAERQRTEHEATVVQEIELGQRRQQAALRAKQAEREFAREQTWHDTEQHQKLARTGDGARREHLAALRELGVDLTEMLTQGRADQVIELRGDGGHASRAHVHLEGRAARGGDGGGA
jgi:hypothetical protein